MTVLWILASLIATLIGSALIVRGRSQEGQQMLTYGLVLLVLAKLETKP